MKSKKSSNQAKIFLGLIIFISLGVLAFVFTGHKRLLKDNKPLVSALKKGAAMEICSVSQKATKDGITQWCLNADSASLLGGEKAVFKKPVVTFFMKDKSKITLKAEQGSVFTKSNDIDVKGDVIMKGMEYELKTQLLSYEHKKRFFYIKSPVKIQGKRFDISADRGTYDLKSGKAVLEGNVKGIINDSITL